MRRERRRLTGSEQVGPYTLLRLEQGGLDAGRPGAVLHARGAGPRAAAADERLPRRSRRAGLPDRPDRPRHARALRARAGRRDPRARSARQRLRPRRRRPLLVGGGIGIAPLPSLSRQMGGPPAILGFRSERHAEAAALLPGAEILHRADVCDRRCFPRCITTCSRAGPSRCWTRWERSSRCASRLGGADGVAWSCYGCAVVLDGKLKRLCVEGPVLSCCLTPRAVSTRYRPRSGARARWIRDENDHSRAAGGKSAPYGSRRRTHGMLNAIGLANPAATVPAETLPRLRELGLPLWVSVDGFCRGRLRRDLRCALGRRRIELNLSCPNVDEAAETAAAIVAACRAVTALPLYAKLSPAAWESPREPAPSRPPGPTGCRS